MGTENGAADGSSESGWEASAHLISVVMGEMGMMNQSQRETHRICLSPGLSVPLPLARPLTKVGWVGMES